MLDIVLLYWNASFLAISLMREYWVLHFHRLFRHWSSRLPFILLPWGSGVLIISSVVLPASALGSLDYFYSIYADYRFLGGGFALYIILLFSFLSCASIWVIPHDAAWMFLNMLITISTASSRPFMSIIHARQPIEDIALYFHLSITLWAIIRCRDFLRSSIA